MSGGRRVLLSWSSGKDCAWALHVLRQQDDVEIVGLLSSFNGAADRVSMHAVRRELTEAQADSAGVPLWPVFLPWPCSNEQYEIRMQKAIDRAKEDGITHIAFGDLFLNDIREYRIRQMAGSGIEPLFPIWCSPDRTGDLTREMQANGVCAIITCVDPKQIDESFVGREFDSTLLEELPDGVDPCGENGEFHTFCYAGPAFERRIDVKLGEIVRRNGFVYADVTAD
ncbi:MAG: adenine nucleotide alpha hydrolase [Pirellulaceae bacterium]|nr:adenine nucleotide alpha hydrolase [Pirellulaceae bacterium]